MVLGLMGAFLFSYLLGSIPFGLVLTKAAGLGDIRAIGSGNIGATNVLRTGKKSLAALTVLLDGGKGALAVLAVAFFFPYFGWAAALGALVGHIFPVWLHFKGGKGVATSIGVITALAWPAGVAMMAAWLLVAVCFRISSLAALVSIGLAPLSLIVFGQNDLAPLGLMIAVITFWTHRANIRRLLARTEPKIGAGKHGAAKS